MANEIRRHGTKKAPDELNHPGLFEE